MYLLFVQDQLQYLTLLQEPAKGIVQQFYESMAVLKTANGQPVFAFWDKECLNDGQNWEQGFLRGLTKSYMIVLLVSIKVSFNIYPSFHQLILAQALTGIINNASSRQDNVLIEYFANTYFALYSLKKKDMSVLYCKTRFTMCQYSLYFQQIQWTKTQTVANCGLKNSTQLPLTFLKPHTSAMTAFKRLSITLGIVL